MPTILTFKDGAKKEHVVTLAEEPEFPADEDEMNALAAELAEKGAANLRAWSEAGTTEIVEPLVLIAVDDGIE